LQAQVFNRRQRIKIIFEIQPPLIAKSAWTSTQITESVTIWLEQELALMKLTFIVLLYIIQSYRLRIKRVCIYPTRTRTEKKIREHN
jgi:hypothetical protein